VPLVMVGKHAWIQRSRTG